MARQSVAILLENEAQLQGVTVTNKATRGTAVWMENGAPKIANCSLIESNREGVFIAGSAKPIVEKS